MYDLTHAVHCDGTGLRVLDRVDMSSDIGSYIRVFKRQIGIIHRTVDKLQILTVAQGLGSGDLAVYQSQSIRKPTKILALDSTVFHGHILPEHLDHCRIQKYNSERYSYVFMFL